MAVQLVLLYGLSCLSVTAVQHPAEVEAAWRWQPALRHRAASTGPERLL